MATQYAKDNVDLGNGDSLRKRIQDTKDILALPVSSGALKSNIENAKKAEQEARDNLPSLDKYETVFDRMNRRNNAGSKAYNASLDAQLNAPLRSQIEDMADVAHKLDERDEARKGNPLASFKKGGKITHYKSASAAVKAAEKRGDKSITVKFSHASKRADGIIQRGHTKGRVR